MKRRDFLRYTTPAVAAPIFLNGLPIRALANSPLLNALASKGAAIADDRILVIVQLFGGNDGVNTVLPTDQYLYLSMDNTQGGRSNILIPETKGLKLEKGGVDQYTGTRLSPNMFGFQQLFNDDKLGFLQGVGYQNPDFSHFRATDIWLSGSDSDKIETTGWAGRDLDIQYPNYYANPYKGPLALTIGSVSSPAFIGNDSSHGLAVQNPNANNGYITGNNDTAPNSLYGYELEYVRSIIEEANQFDSAIKTAYNNGSNVGSYPSNDLANQLKMVARLISGGLGTKIYLVGVGGFDTHANQHDASDPSVGAHVNLWGGISDAITAFQNDLAQQTDANGDALEDRVTGFTFSEFGRTIKSNTTYGTDHGTTGPMFLFGRYVNSAMVGSNPEVYDQAGAYIKADLPLQFDYRSVYASIMYQWFEVPLTDINTVFGKTFLDGSDPAEDVYDTGFHCNLPIFNTSLKGVNVTSVRERAMDVSARSFPNPFTEYTDIEFTSTGNAVNVSIFDMDGRLVNTVANESFAAGKHSVRFHAGDVPKGVYIYRVTSGKQQHSGKMLIQ